MRHKLPWQPLAIAMTCLVGGPVAFAQESPFAESAQPDSPQSPVPTPQSSPKNIQFNFRGATYQQVVEFFSRVTGLPVIWQTPPPEGTLDYISPESYDQTQALRVLNMILQSKGVMLRVSRDNLYLQKLDQMQREDIPTFIGEIPKDVTDDQIISIVRPLKISLAKPLAEKLGALVAPYGSVTAMDQQNTLVVTETAANVRRILTIIEQLDREDPDGAVEIFSIKNAKAAEILIPLKALMSQKVEKFVINQQGQQVKIEEDQMPGLTISADERTNSIIAKGTQNKIDKLKETIALLDIPATSGMNQGRSMTTISLSRVAPAEAVGKLTQLYQRIEEKNRPTVLAMEDAAKVMIVGDDSAISEGTLLVGELENGPVTHNGDEPSMTVIPLRRAAPGNVIAAITSLLNKRQQTATKLIAGTDGKSLIISGLTSDVDAIKSLVPTLDRGSAIDRQVRVLRIAAGDPKAIVDQAQQVFTVANPDVRVSDLKSAIAAVNAQPSADDQTNDDRVIVNLDAEARLLTLIGPLKSIDSFTAALRQIEASVVVDRESKRFVLANTLPSELVGPLQSMAPQVLLPEDGSQYIAPIFAAVDQLNVLMVTATPTQLETLTPLVESMDTASAGQARPEPILMQLRVADAGNLANVIMGQYNQRSAAERKAKPVYVGADPQTNSLIVSAHPEVFPAIKAMVDELNTIERVDSETREVHIYPLKAARAEQLARTMEEIFPQPPVPLDVRGRPQPQLQKPRPVIVRAEPQTNSLIISALPGSMSMTQEMIAQLDVDPAQLSGASQAVHVLTIQNADAAQLAANLEALFSAPGTAGGPLAKPTIRVDAASNSLLVRANEAQLQTIQEVVGKIDKATIASSRQMRMIAIDPSKASANDVAAALKRMLDQSNSGTVQVMTLEELIQQREKKEVDGAKAPPAGASSSILDFGFWILDYDNAYQAGPERSAGPGLVRNAGAPIQNPKSKIQNLPRLNELLLCCIFAQVQSESPSEPDVTIAVDPASNSLIILGSSRAVERVSGLVRQIQDQIPAAPGTIRYVTLPTSLDVNQLTNLLTQTMDKIAPRGGQMGDLRKRTAVIADPAGNALIIAANDTDFQTVGDLLAVLSKPAATKFPIRTVTLRRADAGAVAQAITQFYDERAKLTAITGGRQPQRKVAIAGIETTNTLLISATDEEFAQVESLIEQFDTGEAAAGLTFRVFQLQHAKAADIERTVQNLVNDLVWNQPNNFMFFWPPQPQSNKAKDSIAVRADSRLNALIVTGRGDKFDVVEQMIQMLDSAPPEGEQRIVKFYRMDRVPLNTIAEVVRDSFNQGRQRRPWEPPDPNEVKVRTDPISRSIIVTATAKEQDDVKVMIDAIVAQLAPQTPAASGTAAGAATQSIFIIDLQNVPPETAKTIVETIGLDKPQTADSIARVVSEPIKISLIPGRNAVLILANPSDRETIVGLLKAIDSEPLHAEAHTRIFRLKTAQAAALSQILTQVLNPGEQQSATPLAKAVREQVRRLSVRNSSAPTGGPQSPALTLDLTKPIRVVPDTNLNALIVSSTAENIIAMEGLISMFDQLPISDAVTVQIFPLQNIAAEQFSRIVREMFTQGKQLGKTVVTRVQGIPEGAIGTALLNDIAMTTDERTNSVIVAGSEDAVALVEVLSKRIDSDVIVGWVEPKVLALRFADAAEIAATLQAILVEGAGNLPQSSPIQRQVGRLRMAKLHPNGDPQNVIESDVFTPMTRLVIRAEPKSNALILIGTPANIEIVSELVAMLDVEASSPSGAVRIYPVVNASAARLAQTIRQLFDQQVQTKAIRPEDRVVVQADERTNALIVTTTPRSFAVLEGLLKTLDVKLAPDLREIRMVEVKNASAARLATMIQQLMDARLERLRRVQPETADLERAVVVADTRSNSLVVAAGNDAFEVIKRLATDLDVDTLGDAALVHVLPMPPGASGNIERIAAAVNQIMERRYSDLPQDIRRAQRPLVQTDPRTNSLLVSANPEDLKSIQDLVEKLSAAPTNPAVGLHLIAVPNSTRAETLAPRIQRLMTERQQSMGPTATPSDKVTVEAELASNSLIVAANDENLEIIRGLIDVLVQADATVGSGREVEVVTLSPANRAADIVDMLRDLYVQEANRTRGQNTVRVTADERLNAVVINAPENDVRAIKGLIAQLEGAKPANVVEIKYIVLKSANALETVSLIENVLSGRSLGARRGSRQATVLKYLREMEKGVTGEAPVPPVEDENLPVEMEVSAAIRESISLTPDLRTNTIIVSAPRESITMIERMIRDLDESSTGSKSIRIFKLTNADAIAMAELLTELFQLKQGSNLYVLKPREDQPLAASRPMDTAVAAPDGLAPEAAGGFGDGLGGLGGTELTAVPDERQQLSITVDSRTNSLIVSGTPTYLDLVAKVVDELDKLEANEREVFVYQLRNSVAADVAKVIGEFVAQEQKKLVGTLSADQLGSAARLLEREITIQGDKQSNTVLVSASPRYMDRVKEMIKKLDVDPPQVLIQVMLAEVTLDSKDEWGVNMNAVATIGSATVTGGFGLATTFVPGLGVPNLAVASSDFDLLIRAMKSQGRLQVLSNPSIMAANNAPARIQVGETIRLPVSTSITDNGTSFSSLEKEDLGVILEVTPSINPDGFVRMTINPEISNLSARTTQVSEDFQSPIITRRTADTTVTVQDGQTIVIGGLISDRFERRDRKVPFFGDLPLIGALFRSNTEETAKTELLIVLTPHVIDSPAAFGRIDHITEKEIDRLTVPDAVKESIRRSLLDGTGGLYNASGERIEVKMNDAEGKDE